MKLVKLIIMGILSFFLSLIGKGQNLDANYVLQDLTSEQTKHIKDKLKEAEILIMKYNGQLSQNKYDSKNLDKVFLDWSNSKEPSKESAEYVVEALGAAFGQDIVNSLNYEWQLLTDKYGTDITVIHKIYNVNGFPFSSAQKAYEQKRVGSFEEIKKILKENIEDAKKTGEVKERK